MSVFQLTERQTIADTTVARMFRRLLHCPDIVTYFNHVTGQWVLAAWISRMRRVVEEIEDLGAEMEVVSSPRFVEDIMRCWGGVDYRAKARRLKSKWRAEDRRERESISADQERWDWMRKKTRDRAPIPYGVF